MSGATCLDTSISPLGPSTAAAMTRMSGRYTGALGGLGDDTRELAALPGERGLPGILADELGARDRLGVALPGRERVLRVGLVAARDDGDREVEPAEVVPRSERVR